MLFLSSGTVDVAPKSTATGQQLPGKTVYHISLVLNEIHGDAAVPDLGKARISHTLVDRSQPGEIMNIVAMEHSPKLGRAQPELNRWPSRSCAGRAREEKEHRVVEENEEELDEVGKEMKTDRLLRQPSKNTDNSSHWDRGSSEKSSQGQHVRSSSLGSVSIHTKAGVCGERGAGFSSLSRAVLRRTRQDEARLARVTVSMYGDAEPHSISPRPDPQRQLRRPRSVCVLPVAAPFSPESRTYQPFKRTAASENDQQYRSRKADLRAVDGLNHVTPQRILLPVEVSPGVRQRSRKPRPVSMTVLELKKRGSDEEVDSQKSYSNGGGFLKGGFRWRLFGKTLQDKSREREYDKNSDASPKSSKSEAPKSTFSSLRRSISLRIRRTRPREKGSAGLETEPKDCSRSRRTSEEATMPPQPFSYLTGRTLSTSSRQLEDRGTQYIQYHSMGKVKVMEVPLYPKKLASKPVQEEPPSIWHLIANRFRRKEQPSQLSHSKSTPQYPLARSSKSQPVAIETLADTDSYKGQGKSCTTAKIVSLLDSRPSIAPPSLQLRERRRAHALAGRPNEKHMGNCELGQNSKMCGFGALLEFLFRAFCFFSDFCV